MVCLIKPQFETSREKVGKKGVVREPKVHEEVIEKVISFCLGLGFAIEHLNFSPIRGPEGNIEYLLVIKKLEDDIKTIESSEVVSQSLSDEMMKLIKETVKLSHEDLDK